ncbi:MAG TPA: alpha/beta fold hydrolase [Stellaceae bacterium]|nr:alpha/beta fold hydrolase [Stellaceae bacterium]
MTLASIPAAAIGLDPAFHESLLGPQRAAGAVVWSHGRSLDSEDYKAPTPPYLRVLRDSRWDVYRFDRLRDNDTLSASSRRLVAIVAQLKRRGYHRIVLAGQSFGAFLALMAADDSDAVDAVVATAPAAFGDFQEFYDTWRLNATRLYPLLENIKRARVMLFFFHGDDFDPGGRGIEARAILSRRASGFDVVDQPAYLTGHWISSSGAFLRRFGDCIREFADDDSLHGKFDCNPVWGEKPSAEMILPSEVLHAQVQAPRLNALLGASVPVSLVVRGDKADPAADDAWYGFYPNGREVLLTIEAVKGRELTAIYAIGPGIDKGEPAEWSRRRGRIDGHELVFERKGESTLRFRPLEDGGLSATWISPDGGTKMKAGLRRIATDTLPIRAAAGDEGGDQFQ